MKALWTAVCILAIAHILALAGFAGWLHTSGRLSAERFNKVREIFAGTLAEEAQAKVTEATQREQEAKAAEEAAKAARPPVTALEQLVAKQQLTEKDRQDVSRLAKEVEILRSSLTRERSELDRLRQQLESDRAQFAAMRKKISEQEGTQQFQKTLGVLTTLKPDQAKATLAALLRNPGAAAPAEAAADATQPATGPLVVNGRPVSPPGESAARATPPGVDPEGLELVVGYLNAMDERARAKIVAQFVQEDPGLAAELLERLRTRGIETRASRAAVP